MTNEVKTAVVKVLQQSLDGFAVCTGCWSNETNLPFWKRWFNKLSFLIGAERAPFIDEWNWTKIERKPLSKVTDPKLIFEALHELSDQPKCSICGSLKLTADPAGYYCHAYNYYGAPLLCQEHVKGE